MCPVQSAVPHNATVCLNPAACIASTSLYPSTRKTLPSRRIASRASYNPYSSSLFRYSPPVSELTYFGLSRSSSDNLRAANPASRPSSSRTGNTSRFRIAFQRSGTRQGDCPTPKSNQVGVSSEHPLPAGNNKARKASFSIDNWELTTGNCSASLFSFFSLTANRSGNNLASLLSFPSIANCPLSIDNLFAASTKPTFSILLTKANTSPLSPQA